MAGRAAAVAVVVAALAARASGKDVAVVTGPTYDAFLQTAANDKKWVLLDFFAPWCGHCKRLDPVLDAFAAATPRCAVAKIDATKERGLAAMHGVDGYPTLRFRRAGDAGAFRDHKGGRDEDGLALLDARLNAPAVATVTRWDAKTFEKLAEPAPGALFVAAAPLAPVLQAAFDAVAASAAHFASFAIVSDKAPVAAGSISVLVPGEPPHSYGGAPTEAALGAWVKMHNEQVVSRLGPHNFRRLGHRRLIVAAVGDPADAATATANATLEAAARAGDADVREAFAFGTLDGVLWDEYVATFGVGPADLPKFLVIDQPGDKFFDGFVPPETDAAAALVEYLRAVAAGRVAPRHLGWKGFPDRAFRFWVTHKTAITVALGALLVALKGIERFCFDHDAGGKGGKAD